jgi:hypothetical protein
VGAGLGVGLGLGVPGAGCALTGRTIAMLETSVNPIAALKPILVTGIRKSLDALSEDLVIFMK